MGPIVREDVHALYPGVKFHSFSRSGISVTPGHTEKTILLSKEFLSIWLPEKCSIVRQKECTCH